MISNPAFSIIVPVFNEEKYLAKCVESLRNQTLPNIEIILVDDGSVDRSGLIADWYTRQDKRIRVFHKTNRGQGPARNLGIKKARGKYIGFADADDWVEPEMYQRLYERAEQTCADVVFTGVKLVSHGKITKTYKPVNADAVLANSNSISIYRNHLYGPISGSHVSGLLPGYVFIGCFRHSFLTKTHVIFQDMMSEDTVFLIQTLQMAHRIAFAPGAFYCYRRDNQVSTSNSFNRKTIESYNKFMLTTHHLLANEPDKLRHECLVRWYRNIIDLSRELVHRIESSSLSSVNKSHFIHQVNLNPLLIEASSNYSWRDLPQRFVLFYWCQIHDFVIMERLIMKIWINISTYMNQIGL